VFTAGFSGDCSYRIAISLNPDSQVTELGSLINSMANMRLIMVWPNSVDLSGVRNELTGVASRQSGQYLACAVGGMITGLPSHQGFTYIGISGITKLYNSNGYFTEDQITDLRDGGWYVFVQDGETSLPYTVHEVTTDVSSYDFGELMSVKNFDYIAANLRDTLQLFTGRYNINSQTLEMMRTSVDNAAISLENRVYPKIGARLLGHDIKSTEQSEQDKDHTKIRVALDLPAVNNVVELTIEG